MSGHHLFDPDGLPPASGFSYGALAASGRTLHIAGMTGTRGDGSLPDTLVEQFAVACQGVARVISEGGGDPTDLVAVTIYTTDIEGYRSELGQLGHAYREVFGRHYPPMALIGVSRLFDPDALVEWVCVAVLPDGTPG